MRIATLIFILIFPLICKADFCYKTFEQDSIEAQAIFVGKVIDIKSNKYLYKNYFKTIVTFKVMESFKGISEYTTYTSLIGPIGGCCNEYFEVDSTFLVFAYGDCNDTRILWTNDCSNTGLLSREMENYNKLKYFNKHTNEPDFDFLYYLKRDESIIDSLFTEVENLKMNGQLIERTNKRRNSLNIALSLIIGILGFLLIWIKSKSSKDNANKT